jgi:hypothetical protein
VTRPAGRSKRLSPPAIGFPALTVDAGQDWSVKREEFRSAMMQRVAKTLTIHTPSLSKKSASDIASSLCST